MTRSEDSTARNADRPRRVITRCEQVSGYVEVYGREGAETEEKLFFRRMGLIKSFEETSVLLQGTSGLDETYDAWGTSDEYGPDFLESLREGDPKSIVQFVFIAVVIFIAFITGALEF